MNKFPKYIAAGLLGTVAMTIIMVILPNLGMPEIFPWELLSEAIGVSLVIGWVAHFMAGILFGLGYGFIFAHNIHIRNLWFKGVAYGILANIVAYLGMSLITTSFEILLLITFVPYIILGVVIAKIIGKNNQLYGF
ncbi:DUF6789 family protein [Formosa undariae]|uniref:DUF6789 family protein n=1 Tax=Formosa undariae TaxID=1325436 RepID=A0ABV5EYC6_9FLAO